MSALLAGALLSGYRPSFALNPSLDVSQYAHTTWKIRDGFIPARITAMAQTPDGYLWLGTESGLFRFDGVKVVPWQPAVKAPLPSTYIRCLLATSDSTLWIGTTEGLISLKNRTVTQYPMLRGMSSNALFQDRAGTVWFSSSAIKTARLCAIRRSGVQCYGEAGEFGRWVSSLVEHEGQVWAQRRQDYGAGHRMR